jgi:manganese efflux pump family protein
VVTGQILARLILFALPLGLDTFALSTVLGMTPLPARRRVRLALTFAAAEGAMPAIGLLLGLPLGRAIGAWSNYLAGVLIVGIGVWMIWKERGDDTEHPDKDAGGDADADAEDGEAAKIARVATKGGWATAGLALSASLDELAVGFSFGVLGFPLVPALIIIAVQALLVSLAGQWLGMRAGRTIGERAEHLAGPVLCLLGLWFVLGQLIGLPV